MKPSEKKLLEGWGQEFVARGYGASKNVESACSRDGSYGKVKIQEADGSHSGQKEYEIFVSFHGGVWSGGGRRSLYSGHPASGRRGMVWKMAR